MSRDRQEKQPFFGPGARLLLMLAICLPTALAAAQAPVIDSFSASPPVIAPGEVTTLTVQAHDPDCPDTCTSGCGLYIGAGFTLWSATGGSFVAEDNGSDSSPYSASADWQAPAAEGTYTITVSISDSGSFICGGRQTTTADLDVLVSATASEPPVIESLGGDPLQLFPGETSALNCLASDPDGDPVTYSWQADTGTVTSAEGGSAVFTAGDPGIATVTCTATDPSGAFDQETLLLSVTGAAPEKRLSQELGTPQRLAVDGRGDLYVADPAGGGIAVMNLFSDELVYRIPWAGIRSVDLDWGENLLVGSAAGAAVIDREGYPVRSLAADVNDVADVAVDPVRQRYAVLHRGPGRVMVYDAGGNLLSAFGSTGDAPEELQNPQGLAFTPGGSIVVADSGHGLVKTFDPATGALLSSIGGRGNGVGEFVRLDDVAVSAAGIVYASDSFQDWVQTFNPDGSLREVLGTLGSGVGQFKTPTGLLVADDFHRLLVASYNSSSLQVFRLDAAPTPEPAPVGRLSASALAFPPQAVGTTSAPRTVMLSNDGTSALGLRKVVVSGDFAQAHDCGAFLDPGAVCTFEVTATPAAVGQRTGALVIETSATEGDGRRLEAALEASGFVPPGVWLSPSSLDFSDQELGTTSEPKTLMMINTGTEPLAIAAIGVAGDFAQVNDCGAALAGGTSCAIHVAFTPGSITDHLLGEVRIESNAAAGPHTAPLDGRGIELAAHAGPPTVTRVSSGGRELERCRPAREPMHRVLVQFSEPMLYHQDDPEPGDANHAGSYLLVKAGADQRFDTEGCGAALGDDEAVPLGAVVYDPATSAATLELGGGPLPASLYRLLVCADSPAVRDLAGVPVDGDGDGTGGDDFALTFRSDHPNLFANAHFDCDLGGWTTISVFDHEIEHSPEDVDGSDLSGSVHFVPLTPEAIGIGQCLPVAPRVRYRLGAWLHWSADPQMPEKVAYLVASCEIFAEAECSGAAVDEDTVVLALLDNPGAWVSIDNTLETPKGARSALCSFALSAEHSPEARLDRLVLSGEGQIFIDGFESGDVAAWSGSFGAGGQ